MSQVNMRKALECFRAYRRMQLQMVAERLISEAAAGNNCEVYLQGLCDALDLEKGLLLHVLQHEVLAL